MKCGLSLNALLVLGAVSCLVVPNGRAEVGVSQPANSDTVSVLFSYWPDGGGWPGRWSTVRQHAPASWLLNTGGDVRDDGPPDIAINRETGRAEVVWAIWDGSDYEVAHSEWLGAAWSAAVLLTDNTVDDLDPKLSVLQGGGLGVAWWRDDVTQEVLYAERPGPDQPFSTETHVSDGSDPSQSPAITRLQDTLFVGYESMGPSVTSVIVESRTSPGTFSPEVIASTSRPADLDVRVSEARGHVWAIWIDSPTHLGWSQRSETGWSAPMYEPYDGETDLDRARLRVRAAVLQ